MATVVVLPKQGQTVESCVIAAWKKQPGDQVVEGDVLCEVETDKALLEVTSPAAGTLLELFFPEGADVPVLTNIAVVGAPGEDVSSFRPDGATSNKNIVIGDITGSVVALGQDAQVVINQAKSAVEEVLPAALPGGRIAISPRARNLAEKKDVDFTALAGTGPSGRIIERDVQAALAQMPKLTPLAKTMTASGDFTAPAQGSGLGGKVTSKDLISTIAPTAAVVSAPAPPMADEVEVIPLKGVRKVIASRMLESVQTTAQLTLNVSADARAMQAYRQRLKASDEAMGLQKITINDLILLAVARTLPLFPEVNALFTNNTIYRYKNVHLAVAVDTPRGLVVPVMRHAHTLSLKQISEQAKRLANGAVDGSVSPDLLTGGTFTVTNLGNLGIESFTPVLNPPQVAILGVGNINLKPMEVNGEVKFIPHLGLSLTINHQVVDGAPAARFLQTLAQRLAAIDLALAL